MFESELLRQKTTRSSFTRLRAEIGAGSLTLTLTAYSVLTDHRMLALAGLAAVAACAAATAFHARKAAGSAKLSSRLHASVRVELEQAHDELDVARARLERSEARSRALRIAVTAGLNAIDQRTQGRLSELVEEAANGLATLVDETLVTELDASLYHNSLKYQNPP